MGVELFTSSASDEWSTPVDFFGELNRVFRFDLDAAATAQNAKCERFFTEADDALVQDWGERSVVFLNPPYSKILPFMRRAVAAWEEGATVVALVPSRTDTQWWHECALRGVIVPLRGRLRFGDGTGCAPFACVLVLYLAGKLGGRVSCRVGGGGG